MNLLKEIYDAIAKDGFSTRTLTLIDEYSNNIRNGRTNFPRYTISEHSGNCKAGASLIGASFVAGYARASLEASCYAAEGKGSSPANWQIDELQEQLIEQWAKTARLWVEDSETILRRTYGPMIAQDAEAKVYYRSGDPSVVKERASIYSTTQKALEAIALHNYLFPICIDCIVKFVS